MGADTLDVFEYNEAGQLVKHAQGNFIHRLQYDGDGQLVRVMYTYTDMQSVREHEMTLTYSNGGKTVVIRMPASSLSAPEEHTVELDDNGQMIRYIIPQGSDRIVRRYEYNADGDLLKHFYAYVTPTNVMESLWTTHENFDGKPNPYFTSKSLRMYWQLVRGEPVGRHNSLLTKEYGGDGEVDWTTTRTNAYNDKGELVSQSGRLEGPSYSLHYDLGYTYRCP